VDRVCRVGDTRLSDRDVARVVKRAALAAGLDPAYAGVGVSVEERAIMRQTRQKSVTVAHRYIRDDSLFRGNAAGRVGL
jgi:hypothetical protein